MDLTLDEALSFRGPGGKRYHHILDPREGDPVGGVVSLTVSAESAVGESVHVGRFSHRGTLSMPIPWRLSSGRRVRAIPCLYRAEPRRQRGGRCSYSQKMETVVSWNRIADGPRFSAEGRIFWYQRPCQAPRTKEQAPGSHSGLGPPNVAASAPSRTPVGEDSKVEEPGRESPPRLLGGDGRTTWLAEA